MGREAKSSRAPLGHGRAQQVGWRAPLPTYTLSSGGRWFQRRVVCFLEQKNIAQRVLNGGIGSRRTGCDSHDDFLAQIQHKRFRNNLTIYRAVCDGIVSRNAIRFVDVEGADPGVGGDLQQMPRVGRIPSPNYQNKIQFVLVSLFDQFVNGILPFLCTNQ